MATLEELSEQVEMLTEAYRRVGHEVRLHLEVKGGPRRVSAVLFRLYDREAGNRRREVTSWTGVPSDEVWGALLDMRRAVEVLSL